MAKRTYNRRGRVKAKTPVTNSARRPARVTGAQTARRTGSRDKMTRGRGVSTNPASSTPRGAAGPRTAPAQGPMRRVSGIIGDRQKVKDNRPPSPKRTPRAATKPTSAAVKKLGIGGAAAAVAKGLLLAAATEAVAPQKAADGTLTAARKRGDYKPKQGPRNPEKGMTRAQSFDKAFAAARKAGKKEFTWRGKRYHTRRK